MSHTSLPCHDTAFALDTVYVRPLPQPPHFAAMLLFVLWECCLGSVGLCDQRSRSATLLCHARGRSFLNVGDVYAELKITRRGTSIFCYAYYSHSIPHMAHFRETKLGLLFCSANCILANVVQWFCCFMCLACVFFSVRGFLGENQGVVDVGDRNIHRSDPFEDIRERLQEADLAIHGLLPHVHRV